MIGFGSKRKSASPSTSASRPDRTAVSFVELPTVGSAPIPHYRTRPAVLTDTGERIELLERDKTLLGVAPDLYIVRQWAEDHGFELVSKETMRYLAKQLAVKPLR